MKQTAQVRRIRQEMASNQAAWNATRHRTSTNDEQEYERDREKELDRMASKATVTLYTLAPVTLDKPGTESVGAYWLYRDATVPEQALREVIVPRGDMVAQMQAYRLKIPYITFSEEGLGKALAKGIVYRHDDNGIACDPIKAAISVTTNTKEATPMAKNPKRPVVVTPQVATTDRAPRGIQPAPSALDAILATPIVVPVSKEVPAEELMPQAVLDAVTRKAVPLPTERTEAQLVAGMAPGFAMHADMYKAFVQAFKQALADEGLVMVPQTCLTAPGVAAAPAPVKDPDIWDILGDGTGAPVTPVPVKPVSTLRLFTGTSAPHEARQRSGKTPVETIHAIQRAWKSGKVTQADLAEKYKMNEKKVWYFCNRAKQLV
jgi:hypothetical protein